jgi:hypothetical protein
MYFIKYLVGVFRKQPFESDWNYETLSFFDPVAQDKIGFNLQQSIWNENLHAIDKLKSNKQRSRSTQEQSNDRQQPN